MIEENLREAKSVFFLCQLTSQHRLLRQNMPTRVEGSPFGLFAYLQH